MEFGPRVAHTLIIIIIVATTAIVVCPKIVAMSVVLSLVSMAGSGSLSPRLLILDIQVFVLDSFPWDNETDYVEITFSEYYLQWHNEANYPDEGDDGMSVK